jgi:hypothetical protein
MGYLSSLGKVTKNTILKSTPHKLHEEFTVASANTVYQGQPVKLNAAGEVAVWATGDGDALLLGYAMCQTPAAAGELVTIAVRGFMTIMCITSAAVNCGPVQYGSYDTSTDIGGTTGYNVVATATVTSGVAASQIGWALDLADSSNDLIRVLLKY